MEKKGGKIFTSNDFKSGDLLFVETPFAIGPSLNSRILCLGCFEPIDDISMKCEKCLWPICSMNCPKISTHLDNECGVFQNAGVEFEIVEDPEEVCPQYDFITPLRTLLSKERNEEQWKEMNEPDWKKDDSLVNFIRETCKLDRFLPDLINSVSCVLASKALDVRAPSGYYIRCLYPKLSQFQHSCVSNIFQTTSTETYELTARTALQISKNIELNYCYCPPLLPTLIRREFLLETRNLTCECIRCRDKTELGTHLSTLKCSKCDNGIILSTEPLNNDCVWSCTHCEFKTSARAVRKIYNIIQGELDSMEYITGAEGIQCREGLFRKYRSVLHPKNSYMTMLRVALSQLYGHAPGYTVHEMPDLLQERKLELCTQLLEVLEVLEPGVSRTRGVTLYEMHAPLIIIAKNEYNYGVIEKDLFRERMNAALEILRESVAILKLEAPNSDEYQLGITAKESYQALSENFEMLIETA